MTVERDGAEVTLRPKQLVMATGMSARARLPEFPGIDEFNGDQHHSSQHPRPRPLPGQARGRDRI